MTGINLRPQHLDEMAGQEAIKRKARIVILASLQRGEPLPHCLLTSPGGGLGKTSFASILSNETFSPIISTTGQCIESPHNLRSILVRLEPRTILLIDEFHGIGRSAADELLLILDEGVLNISMGANAAPVRIPVPPFTLCAATTRPAAIAPELMQRFATTYRFEFYSQAEIEQVVQGIFARWGMRIDAPAAGAIACRARGVPRLALRLCERVRDVVDAQNQDRATLPSVEMAMEIEEVDVLGLSREERSLLAVLAQVSPSAVSARSLALALGVGIKTVEEVLEPPLVRLGLMMIGVGGRRLTRQGAQHLESVGVGEVA